MSNALDSRPAPASAPAIDTRARWSARLDRLWPYFLWTLNVLLVLFLLSPLVVIVFTSLNDRLIAFPPQSWTFASYGRIPGYLYQAMRWSLQLGAISAAIAMTLAFPTTIALARGRIPGRNVLQAFFQSPLQVPAIVIGIALYQFYIVLAPTGVMLRGTFSGLVIGHVLLIFPFILTSMFGRVASIDPNLEQAAYGLGAGFFRTSWQVTLPLMRPALIAGGFLAFLVSFDDVAISLFLVGPGVTTLPVSLLFTAEQALEPWLYAMSTIVVIFSFVLALVVERVFGLRTVLGSS